MTPACLLIRIAPTSSLTHVEASSTSGFSKRPNSAVLDASAALWFSANPRRTPFTIVVADGYIRCMRLVSSGCPLQTTVTNSSPSNSCAAIDRRQASTLGNSSVETIEIATDVTESPLRCGCLSTLRTAKRELSVERPQATEACREKHVVSMRPPHP